MSNEEMETTKHSIVSTLDGSNPALPPATGPHKKTRRKHRGWGSKKRKRLKPYSKMTFEERCAMEQREEQHAEETRKQRFEHGIPVAPYNTTQFLVLVSIVIVAIELTRTARPFIGCHLAR